jgi:hypothetical protein
MGDQAPTVHAVRGGQLNFGEADLSGRRSRFGTSKGLDARSANNRSGSPDDTGTLPPPTMLAWQEVDPLADRSTHERAPL